MDNAILVLGDSHETDGANFLSELIGSREGLIAVRFGTTNGCGEIDLSGDWPVSNQDWCNKRLKALKNSIAQVEWKAILYSTNLPYQSDVLTTLLTKIKAAQPEVRIALMSRFINTKRPCAQYINRFGSANACKKPEHVSFFDPYPAERGYAKYEEIMGISDIYIDKVALFCEDRKLENCIVETPDGVPMFVDTHHLTMPFAKYMAELYQQSGEPDLIEALGLLD